ncbi:MAG: DUF192 domain-containing protein [Actinomycetota bacterium]|nr:DUF192 domain-containing protein [Actinomycetota bacterium]
MTGASRWRVALLIVGMVAASCGGGNSDGESGSGERTPVPGFGEIAFRIDGGTLRHALLADTTEQHSRGLMNRTDLAGYDGMLFRFPSDTTGTFYMLNTPLPLSIAWFDADGRFVSATDMEPCLNRSDCPTYAASGPYRYALEVPQGDLAELGIGPGSRLELEESSS